MGRLATSVRALGPLLVLASACGGTGGYGAGPTADGGPGDTGTPAADARAPAADAQAPPGVPAGVYVVNNVNGPNQPYDPALLSSPGYAQVDGHAIFAPISSLFTSAITQWPPTNFDWTNLAALIRTATSNHKAYSLAFEVGAGLTLPPGFEVSCNPSGATATACAPQFHVWTNGGKCLDAPVLLPWRPAVQQFWQALATQLATQLAADATLGQPTLIHLPGLSVYDEELRLPSGFPPPPSMTSCMGGDVTGDVTKWPSYGYSYANIAAGFASVASAFAAAFPKTYLGLSLFNPLNGPTQTQDFWPDPAVTSVGQAISPLCSSTTYFATTKSGSALAQCLIELVAGSHRIAPGRVLIQSDDLGSNHLSATGWVLPEVPSQVARMEAAGSPVLLGWQSNRESGTGALCCGNTSSGTVCSPSACDSENGVSATTLEGSPTSYFSLLKEGWVSSSGSSYGARYLEVFSSDVVAYATSLAAAKQPPSSFYPAHP